MLWRLEERKLKSKLSYRQLILLFHSAALDKLSTWLRADQTLAFFILFLTNTFNSAFPVLLNAVYGKVTTFWLKSKNAIKYGMTSLLKQRLTLYTIAKNCWIWLLIKKRFLPVSPKKSLVLTSLK